MIILPNFVIIIIVCYGVCNLSLCQEMRARRHKYILLLSEISDPLFLLRRHSFRFNNCSETNCYITGNKNYFYGSMRNFDAVIFNGQFLPEKLEIERFVHQKYVYANMEASSDHPICNPNYDGFFNWTATYKLDSDFPFPYFDIKNSTGHTIGPSPNMQWIQPMHDDINKHLAAALERRTRAVVWFVSNCTLNHRNLYVLRLKEALQKFNLTIDIYGKCGTYKCPKNNLSKCLHALRKDYFFYLALETADAEDYVTDKVVSALHNNVVPIVYGGADYNRFLPPSSYLNAKNYSEEDMAQKIYNLVHSPQRYHEFFKWKHYYKYSRTKTQDLKYIGDSVCKICEALNDDYTMGTETTVKNIRSWWDPNYIQNCILSEAKQEDKQSVGIEEIPKKREDLLHTYIEQLHPFFRKP